MKTMTAVKKLVAAIVLIGKYNFLVGFAERQSHKLNQG